MLNMVNTIHCAAYTPLQQPVQNLPCNVYRGGLLHTHTEECCNHVTATSAHNRQISAAAQTNEIHSSADWTRNLLTLPYSRGGHDLQRTEQNPLLTLSLFNQVTQLV